MAMAVSPQIASSRNSGGPKARISCSITGRNAIRMKIPNVEPSADALAAQAIAVLASPRTAMG